MSALRTSVIVPTYRRFSYLIDTLNCLLQQGHENLEIIVADQNPSWPSELLPSVVRLKEEPRVKWLSISANGVVNARHCAVEAATGDVFIFVDDDVRIDDRDFVKKHLLNYEDRSIDAVQGRELTQEEAKTTVAASYATNWQALTPLQQTLGFARNSASRVDVCCFCTCNASVRRSSFFKIGGFDEGFRGASYGDDYDFAIRLAEAGGRVVFDPECELIHLKAPLGGLRFSDRANAFTQSEKALSGIIFCLRHGRGIRSGRLFYSWVLRRTVLLRSNIVAPWRMPKAVLGLISAYREAARVVRAGPTSRFVNRSML